MTKVNKRFSSLNLVIAGNARQMGNPAVVEQCKAWIRRSPWAPK